MSVYKPVADIGPLPIWDGVTARAVEGKEMTLAVVELAPNSHVLQHHHANEQIGVVLKGTMTFTIGGEKRDLVAGDTYCIPGNVPHEAVTGPNGAVVIDCFAPVRADWRKFTAEPPSRPSWP